MKVHLETTGVKDMANTSLIMVLDHIEVNGITTSLTEKVIRQVNFKLKREEVYGTTVYWLSGLLTSHVIQRRLHILKQFLSKNQK
jgi:hypothetical protein